MEDLEEVLLDSIRASVRGKKDAAAKEAGDDAKKAAKRKAGSDGEEDSDMDEDDDFYDRTISKSKKSKGLPGAPQGKGASKKKAPQKAVTVEELFGRKEALVAEAKRLREAVALEEAVAGGEEQQKGGDAEPSVDPLDAFMSSVETAMEVGVPLPPSPRLFLFPLPFLFPLASSRSSVFQSPTVLPFPFLFASAPPLLSPFPFPLPFLFTPSLVLPLLVPFPFSSASPPPPPSSLLTPSSFLPPPSSHPNLVLLAASCGLPRPLS